VAVRATLFSELVRVTEFMYQEDLELAWRARAERPLQQLAAVRVTTMTETAPSRAAVSRGAAEQLYEVCVGDASVSLDVVALVPDRAKVAEDLAIGADRDRGVARPQNPEPEIALSKHQQKDVPQKHASGNILKNQEPPVLDRVEEHELCTSTSGRPTMVVRDCFGCIPALESFQPGTEAEINVLVVREKPFVEEADVFKRAPSPE
jgi:hypothetical protein